MDEVAKQPDPAAMALAAERREPAPRGENRALREANRKLAHQLRDPTASIAVASTVMRNIDTGNRRVDKLGSIAEMHGGSVRVISAGAGCGSEFIVCLPLPVANADGPK